MSLSARSLAVAAALVVGGQAEAGWYAAPTAKWASFAARPLADEPTPNYLGYGGALSLGYSAQQAFDFGVFGSYIPGRHGVASFGKDDVSLVSYGGELGVRVAESVYFGLKGGVSTYHLYGKPGEDEVPGRWHGPSGGVSIGAVAKTSKESFFHATFDVMQHVLEADDEEDGQGKRRFDSFSISLSYMFNSYDSRLIGPAIFKDFLDSIISY